MGAVRGVAGCVAMLVLAVAPSASAQTRPELRLGVSPQVVEVGGTVQLSLSAMTSGGPVPTDPIVVSAPGFKLVGRSIVPSQQVSIVNGHMTQRQGLSATWALEATKEGTATLGPVTVVVGAGRVSAGTATVKVVPRGQAPRPRPQRDPMDPFGDWTPFDAWKDFLPQTPFPQDDLLRPQPSRDAPPGDPRLALPAPRGDMVFLNAVVDKTRAMVGEQVTLVIHLYSDVDAPSVEVRDFHEASAPDFLKQSAGDNDKIDRVIGFGEVAGRTYAVRQVRKFALFPLKSGDLTIGPMSVGLAGIRGTASSRDSQSITVRVAEPPVARRPPGYTTGDVGRFALRAEVTPRAVDRGGAVAVNVELSGLGNLPSTLAPPLRPGVEWLEPQMRESVGPDAQGRVGGKRTFLYVVRALKDGPLDLGAFTLPYWDPDAKAYGVARAELGTIEVRPVADTLATTADGGAAASGGPPDPLPGLPPLRSERGGTRVAGPHHADGPAFWLTLAAPTFAFAGFAGTRAAARRLRVRLAARAASPEADVRVRHAAAAAACAGTDARVADAAVARAIDATVLARTGVNVRGISVDAVARTLEEAGVDGKSARALQEVLDAGGSARFSPADHDIDAARARWVSARAALAAIRPAGARR